MISLVLSISVFTGAVYSEPDRADALLTMRKAADFMSNTVSNRGGYVFQYKADLSDQWGEVPARKSQIWVQPPGTPSVGMLLLDAYRATGDHAYLEYAGQTAKALIHGQHPAGGWHYLVDFDMPGIRTWYDEVASKCWGWEEYIHYYGNCTFDDEATTAPTAFLMEMYMTTLDPTYREPLIRALDFIVEAQYPNGGWPQRYPLRHDFVHGGHSDYTSHYTFNDLVMRNNIEVLLDAYEKLGTEKYREAAVRGMNFYIIAQMPEPQAGWADQYDMDLQPAWGRLFEPPAVASIVTVRCIQDLSFFYTVTGNKKYLEPIPAAIDWLESSAINDDPSKKFYHPYFKTPRSYTHAYYYEPDTNKPVYAHRSGSGIHDERFWINNDFEDMYPYGPPFVLNLDPIKREYNRLSSLTPAEAMVEYQSKKVSASAKKVDEDKIAEIMSSTDDRGAWVTEIAVPDYLDDALGSPIERMPGISIRVYTGNMHVLIDYINSTKE